ncbi:MAG: hypothetical protein ACI9IA_001123 [Enterobacterales bacterium]
MGLSYSISATEQYRITLLRAAPGNFESLINQVKEYRTHKKGEVSIMRHSQGDHWDLMMLEPAGKMPTSMKDFRTLADFQHSFLAQSETVWSTIKSEAKKSSTYHIEMFHAVHGKADALLEQRRMENAYLAATQQQTNVIFETTFGSDVDSFTVGFHKDLSSFAATPDLPKETFEQAAKDAGFKNRADLSFYLRSLILSHHDTLAGRVD